MQLTLAALAPFIVAVSAQTWNDIPACAQPCILNAVATVTSCGSTDYQCICASRDAVQTAATSCVITACGVDVALNQVLPAVNAACNAIDGHNHAITTYHGGTTSAPTVTEYKETFVYS
ncbi:hypothetical protein F4678DRAFT_459331 [Xylaria arbuscula]|nr:hypothetical protein F4678DRAFT_459331 [Xylaria arbuscula]